MHNLRQSLGIKRLFNPPDDRMKVFTPLRLRSSAGWPWRHSDRTHDDSPPVHTRAGADGQSFLQTMSQTSSVMAHALSAQALVARRPKNVRCTVSCGAEFLSHTMHRPARHTPKGVGMNLKSFLTGCLRLVSDSRNTGRAQRVKAEHMRACPDAPWITAAQVMNHSNNEVAGLVRARSGTIALLSQSVQVNRSAAPAASRMNPITTRMSADRWSE